MGCGSLVPEGMRSTWKLAFVAPRFADDRAVGGAETLLRRLAERMAARGHEVSFLTTCAVDHRTWKNERRPGAESHGSLRVQFFPVDASRDAEAFIRLQEKVGRQGTLEPSEEISWYRNNVHSTALYRHLSTRAANLDFIIAGPYLFGLSMAVAQAHPEKVVVVPCLHDEPFARLGPVRRMFKSCRGFLFNSVPEMKLAHRLYGTNPERCAVVGMGLEPFDSDGDRFRRRHGLWSPYVIYSGRREPLKGTPLLIEYMKALRKRHRAPVHLVLTGSGEVPLSVADRKWIHDLGVLPEQEKYDAMAGALLFCHPSSLESLGIVVLESWLALTPVLVNARSEVLRDHCQRSGGGLWFGNYPEFEEEFLYLMQQEELRRRMAQQGRQYVLREYSWPQVEKRLMAALEAFSRLPPAALPRRAGDEQV